MFFAKTFVINLAFNADRLAAFRERVPKCLGEVVVWPAVHGDRIQPPAWWSAGNGAWGCYRSHLQILENCFQNEAESYLVLEDDAIFRADFEQELDLFMSEVPKDWQQLYLGGQLYHEWEHPPKRVGDQVFIPYNVNRTHAFAVHSRGYSELYRHLNHAPFEQREHIDHHLGRLHESGTFRVYCPAKWLVGQDGGPSNIGPQSIREPNPAKWWADPERCSIEARSSAAPFVPAVFLEASMETALELERRGWHRGKWLNEHRLDRGVCAAIASPNVRQGLNDWYAAVYPEAVREGLKCVCLHHPNLSWQCVQTLDCARFVRIQAGEADDAERQLIELKTEGEASRRLPRNLIYHIWPRKQNETWRWNIEQLLQRVSQFDGIRSIAVATSPDSHSLVEVQRAFDGFRVDNWIESPNDAELGEVVSFEKLLRTIERERMSYTFYGHAKGVSYDDQRTLEWTQMLYEICLDDPEYIEAALSQKPTAGPFTVLNKWPGGNAHGWYFSGAFYWFRNADAFAKPNALTIRQDRWGAELWPGGLFEQSDAGVLFGQNAGYLYEHNELQRMREWLDEWKSRSRKAA